MACDCRSLERLLANLGGGRLGREKRRCYGRLIYDKGVLRILSQPSILLLITVVEIFTTYLPTDGTS